MKKLLTEWRKFLNERIMYHSTSPENAEAILSQGLKVGRESSHTQAGAWAEKVTMRFWVGSARNTANSMKICVNFPTAHAVKGLFWEVFDRHWEEGWAWEYGPPWVLY